MSKNRIPLLWGRLTIRKGELHLKVNSKQEQNEARCGRAAGPPIQMLDENYGVTQLGPATFIVQLRSGGQ